MIALDTNVLVYANRPEMPLHAAARAAVAELAEGREQWALPWPCLHEFLATVTRPLFAPPSTTEQALDQMTAWLESSSVVLLNEGPAHARVLGDLLLAAAVTGPRVHDARIAAICIEHGVSELITMDRDFARFPSLRTRSLLT